MTRKHFIKIVSIIRQAKRDVNDGSCRKSDMVDKLQTSLADLCQENNKNFDRERFISACTI